MKITTLLGGAADLATLAIAFEEKQKVLLEQIGKAVTATAKELPGHEDVQGAGGFASWEPLADSTIEYKESHGYTRRVSATDPNLRTGDMAESYTYIVHPDHSSVVVGSPLDQAVYAELGTKNQPPRPVLGIAAEQNRKNIEAMGIEVAITVFRNI